jgi:hypothetical protein
VISVDPVIQATLRLGLAALFASAARHKWRDLAAFRAALARYALLPERAVGPAALGLAACEVALALALLAPAGARAAGAAAAALLALYSAAIAVNLARGRRDIDCGCAGPGHRRALGGGLIARNALLALGAALCALPVAPRPLVWLDAWTLVAASAALGLLYAALDAALANAPRLRALRGAP